MPPIVKIIADKPSLATKMMPWPLSRSPFPPAIVMEKGESLDDFVARSAPDAVTTVQVLI
jgi:hypothetical protein